ncbi:MAG TPA: SDR family oxidoreductase [Steroidobacteraceae bacterium]|jgi:NAD(P)-dependent dehydrogenase (short-subunit alcohol dehydrogenase family)
MADKVALITGAGSGIGRGVAIAFLKDGYRVVLAGRRKEPLDETASLAAATVKNALSLSADVTDPGSVHALFAKVHDAFGRLDVLFNNAGVNAPGVPMEDLSLAQWNTVISTNLTGAFLCTQEAMRIMKAQTPRGGRIINNGSISAHSPRPNSAPYTASKHAITGLTKSTSLDGRAFDIACGQIDIGNAATDFGRSPDAAGRPSGATGAAARGTPAGTASGTGGPGGLPRSPEPQMDVKYVAQAVLQMANLPLEANVQFMTIMATKMPFIGRG